MAVIKKVDDTHADSLCWITTGGLILCTNRSFSDLFGYKSVELLGKNIRTIGHDDNNEDMEKMLKTIFEMSEATTGGDSLDMGLNWEGSQSMFNIVCKHKYGSAAVRVSVGMHVGGSDSAKIVVLRFRPTEQGQGVIAITEGGVIQYCSHSIEQLLGFTTGVLSSGSVPLGKLLPMPIALLHQHFVEQWSKAYTVTGLAENRPISCTSGRTVHLHHKSGALVPVNLTVGMMREGDNGKTVITAVVEKSTYENPWTDLVK